ncbi:MAG: anaerobic sulfatase maturase [Tepidisphaerales bacterium]
MGHALQGRLLTGALAGTGGAAAGEPVVGGGPFHVMAKPIGPICNLDCRYCFYLEKEAIYAGERKWAMPDDVLEGFIRQYIQSQDVPEVSFAWQGGEPTLLGVRFFERVVELQKRYADGRVIHNALQTNGTLLDDAWGRFLRRENFLVGISIDGPEDLHDAYRRDKKGGGSYRAVMAGLRTLKTHGVTFNTLTVVSNRNVGEPQRVYNFLKGVGSTYMQFIPLVERVATAVPLHVGGRPWNEGRTLLGPPRPDGSGDTRGAADVGGVGGEVSPWTVAPEAYGRFLCEVFDLWLKKDVGRVFVQLFEVALGKWMEKLGYGAVGGGLCVFAETCGDALAMEHNGDVYACDHYVYPEYRLGNLRETPLRHMVDSAVQRKFGTDKRDTLPSYCRRCDVRFACNGECPKHRFATTPDGEAGLNYLCPAYQRFFRHIDGPMRAMARALAMGRPAAEALARA